MRFTRAEEYRARARDCEVIARLMSGLDAKSIFEKQVEKWLKLAERADTDERKNRRVRSKPPGATATFIG